MKRKNKVFPSLHRLCVGQMASTLCLWTAGLLWGRPCSPWWRGCVTQTACCAAKPASTPTTSPLSLMGPAAWEPATSALCWSLWPTSRESLRSPTRTHGSGPCSTPTSRGWSSASASTTTKASCSTPSNASTTGVAGPAPVPPSPSPQISSSANPNPTSARSWSSSRMGAPTTTSGYLHWPSRAKVRGQPWQNLKNEEILGRYGHAKQWLCFSFFKALNTIKIRLLEILNS